jgi:dolichol-phosphate mannosyltransferase
VSIASSLAAAVVLARLARGRSRRPPLGEARAPDGTISVVVPARDEAARIGPCLDGLLDPDVTEVLVVDDCSSDGTAALARARGARVIAGREPPPGWVGKPWALQQGLEAARGDIVISVDADTRPRPGLARALCAALRDADLVTAGCRFVCDTPGERWLHPAMLATLVYRFGPTDVPAPRPPERVVSNGQCTAVRRDALLAAGGYAAAAGHMTDDAALARALARDGWRVAFHDGRRLIDVDMHDSAAGVWREWGRSLAMPDVTPPLWQAADLAVVWLALAQPVLRVVARRARPVEWALLSLRWAVLAAVAPAYARRGAPFWLSPLADPAVALRFTWSALRPTRRWRGRTYATPNSTPMNAISEPVAMTSSTG